MFSCNQKGIHYCGLPPNFDLKKLSLHTQKIIYLYVVNEEKNRSTHKNKAMIKKNQRYVLVDGINFMYNHVDCSQHTTTISIST